MSTQPEQPRVAPDVAPSEAAPRNTAQPREEQPDAPQPHEDLLTPGRGAFRSLKSKGDPAAIGIEIVLAVLIGLAAGHYGDQHFGTTPWLTLLGVLAGCGAAAKAVYRLVQDADRSDDNKGSDNQR